MSDLLLDTHILLWWLTDDNKLPSRFHGIIADAHILCFVSAATIWEIGIKRALGKLDAPTNLVRIVRGEAFELISITAEHAEAAAARPPHHRDPFDRMLIAQAGIEDLRIATVDAPKSLPVGTAVRMPIPLSSTSSQVPYVSLRSDTRIRPQAPSPARHRRTRMASAAFWINSRSATHGRRP